MTVTSSLHRHVVCCNFIAQFKLLASARVKWWRANICIVTGTSGVDKQPAKDCISPNYRSTLSISGHSNESHFRVLVSHAMCTPIDAQKYDSWDNGSIMELPKMLIRLSVRALVCRPLTSVASWRLFLPTSFNMKGSILQGRTRKRALYSLANAHTSCFKDSAPSALYSSHVLQKVASFWICTIANWGDSCSLHTTNSTRSCSSKLAERSRSQQPTATLVSVFLAMTGFHTWCTRTRGVACKYPTNEINHFGHWVMK